MNSTLNTAPRRWPAEPLRDLREIPEAGYLHPTTLRFYGNNRHQLFLDTLERLPEPDFQAVLRQRIDVEAPNAGVLVQVWTPTPPDPNRQARPTEERRAASVVYLGPALADDDPLRQKAARLIVAAAVAHALLGTPMQASAFWGQLPDDLLPDVILEEEIEAWRCVCRWGLQSAIEDVPDLLLPLPAKMAVGQR